MKAARPLESELMGRKSKKFDIINTCSIFYILKINFNLRDKDKVSIIWFAHHVLSNTE